ncbi:MAG: LPS export ABC transporter permease LptF [Rhodospirillales bacterium]|nr:LPS export ABC transporter permease LptF [Rhodospirillales bacterium]
MVFDRYLFKTLTVATTFVALTLTAVIFLTQSLRFLELVINAGASSGTFAILTLLALPRFLEIILPIALMIGTVFVYNRMTVDNEIVIMRATGTPPLVLARPALVLSLVVAVILWGVVMWLGPKSLSSMNNLRHIVKEQYSTLLFQEGVFNSIGDGLTVYVRQRTGSGELLGLMIHDSRDNTETPATIIAKRGVIVSTPDGQQVVVYDGSRQSLDKNTHVLSRLDFERYIIDLPNGGATPIAKRWREPDERTFLELFHPDMSDVDDVKRHRQFFVEIHRRIISPLLAPAYTLIVLSFLLVGPVDRRGQGLRIGGAVLCVILVQVLYLSALSLARHQDAGLVLIYILVFSPIVLGLFSLSPGAEKLRQKWLYDRKRGIHT